jgi:2-polyprenyl-3-methyl-5-hydroxy-6-metoxy-1,4-benzoquinol methylase
MAVTQVRTMPPLKLSGLMHSSWASQLVKTAVELDVFTTLKGSQSSAKDLASKLQLDERATRLMCDALTSLELLTKDSQGRYSLTETSEAYLVKTSDYYFGRYILANDLIGQAWAKLTDSIRSGKPQARVNSQKEGEEFFRDLVVAIFPMNFSTAQTLADEMKISSMSGEVRVLDLAAGSGVWSLPMAQANKNVRVDALDFPTVLEVTKEFATRFGVADRYSYLSGAWREVKLQPEQYDVIILGHILHSEGKQASIDLLKYCSAALKKGGTLVVAEFLENEDRSGPMFPALFAINMMLATETGCVFTTEELKGMLQDAGLHDAHRLKLPYWEEQSPVMTAKK